MALMILNLLIIFGRYKQYMKTASYPSQLCCRIFMSIGIYSMICFLLRACKLFEYWTFRTKHQTFWFEFFKSLKANVCFKLWRNWSKCNFFIDDSLYGVFKHIKGFCFFFLYIWFNIWYPHKGQKKWH